MPLREGGSLPALAEADDGFKYVLKFRGAGNGIKLLIAELIGGLIAKKLGFKVPELVFANLLLKELGIFSSEALFARVFDEEFTLSEGGS